MPRTLSDEPGKVIVDAKYEKVEIRDNGIAMVTNITGKTQTINLK